MGYAQPRTHPRKWDAQNFQRFCDTNGSANLDQTTSLCDNKKKKNEKKSEPAE